jgi:hypothetical protein
MARVSYTSAASSPFRQLLGHNPELLEAFSTLSGTVASKLSLPPDLKEEVRASLAVFNGCRY